MPTPILLQDLAAYLQGQGVATLDVDLFYGYMPDFPDVCFALFEYSGGMPERTLGHVHSKIAHPKIQVRTRGIKGDFTTPRQMQSSCISAFEKIVNSNLVTGYQSVMPLQEPFTFTRDQNTRVEFMCNFEVMRVFSS